MSRALPHLIRSLGRSRRGVSALEYGILLAVVASVVFFTIGNYGGLVGQYFDSVVQSVEARVPS